MQLIDIETWERKPQYDFFKDYDNPFFNITAQVDVTGLYADAKARQQPFFLACLYWLTKAVNQVPAFKLRLHNGAVVAHETIHCSSTVMKPDGNFTFGYFPFDHDVTAFCEAGKVEIEKLRTQQVLDGMEAMINVIHVSVIPWISFTSLQHARKFKTGDSIPKITLGKYTMVGDRRMMPVSVEVHHALMDGLHVGQYFAALEKMGQEGL
ncbi:chloramphenicol O-acetyltransferase type A [Chitinophaga skermanii]|uniref:Chloramphenicol O-acetyltransferase type A n=1 Tax=Chitinophaga skermanii TaxID=331697 RepID=A0A327QQN0_9BACT|nr:chloramphenicol acetyltransferase [Chitinophaga skermanii]RAJ06896.1 chloramphenicol O-acetyltransferase type A [Chitinophaga skermanii]